MYIWELPDWPIFRCDANKLAQPLALAHLQQGRLLGRMERLGFALQLEATLEATTEEAVKNAEIEGEIFNRDSVRSSIARRLGVPDAALGPADRRAEGIVDMTLDATRNCTAPLTHERLFAWQAALFPTGRSGLHAVKVAAWRDDAHGPMQVVSGPIGREKVQYQAPPAVRIEAEMQAFLAWFNEPLPVDGILRAAIAHLWFVTIHPFDDGNGRIARALADMVLARAENSPQRFYSLSGQIRRDRSSYYGSLERTQKGDLDITACLLWFVECFARTLDAAEFACANVLSPAPTSCGRLSSGTITRSRRSMSDSGRSSTVSSMASKASLRRENGRLLPTARCRPLSATSRTWSIGAFLSAAKVAARTPATV